MRDGHSVPMVFIVAPGGLRGPGGIGRLVATTVHHWREAGLQPPVRVIDPYGPALSPATFFQFVAALAQVAWNARRGRIALLHVHMASRGSAVRKGIIMHLAARMRVPIVLHLHGSRLDEIHPTLPGWARRALRATFALADRIIAPGVYWRGVLIDTVGIDPAVVRVVSEAAVGPADVGTRPRSAQCELAFVGALGTRKGLGTLLEALAHPDLAPLSWRLRVAGSGDVRPFAQRAQTLGIADRVDFVGRVSEAAVHDLLASADVFALPSNNEGLSVALLEAMAHGCAVVTTPVGATRDAVSDGESGLLVPPGDPDKLAAALRRVICDRDLRARLQAGARRRWSASFGIAEHCRRLLAVYEEVRPPLAGRDDGRRRADG